MPSSTSNSDLEFTRVVPILPWKGIAAAVALLSIAALGAWEIAARHAGYRPAPNDTADLWAQQRARVKPDSIVLVGTSRMLFDADLDTLEKGLGSRPVQLALAGSCPFPVLADLAADPAFHGTVIVDIVPAMFLAPPPSPPYAVSAKALKRTHEWNHAQRWSHSLGLVLEENLAFIKQEDLTLGKLLKRLPIPNRPEAQVGPAMPPYFYSVDRDRRGRMFEQAAVVGSPLQQRVSTGWLPLFTPPPPPSFIPAEQFGAMMGHAIEARFRDTQKAVAALRARGAKVVFVRLPVTGPLVAQEEKFVPLAAGWDRLVKENGVPAVNFADHADLSAFDCPEWSHLSAPDSVEFTKKLVPYLQSALKTGATTAAPPTLAAR